MKTLISALILVMVLMVGRSHCVLAVETEGPAIEASATGCMEISGPVTVETQVAASEEVHKGNFITNNWGTLFMGLFSFYDVIARLTPTKKDNSIVNLLTTLYNALVPNLKKGGGKL